MSFASRDGASLMAGTRIAPPVELEKNRRHEKNEYILWHWIHQRFLLKDKSKWSSHSVLVVDMSGSMRRDDVNRARCRSDGVFLALARDFVKMQLDEQLATENDLVSVILMRDTSEVVIYCEPLDWVLYNKLIDMRDWTECHPSGAGNYLPALEVAESLLAVNHKVKALALMFFSDGKPSDNGPFAEKMGEIASKYRRRLSFCCIGMADDNEDFRTLNDMVSEADAYGAVCSFHRPSLDTESLSNIISSMSSTLTMTKTEMTDVATGRTRVLRHDIRSERKGAADDLQLTNEWRIYALMLSIER
jgi:hypothetical protein